MELNFVLRKSGSFWVALCLENGIAGQGEGRDRAVEKLKEAVESFNEVCESEENVCHAPVSTKELHEFLAFA